MDNQVRNIAPFINDRFLITSPWWSDRNGTIHRGLDIATSGSKPLYSILDGYVHSIGYDASGRGNWIIIKDPMTGYATLYMHLASKPTLPIGQVVQKNDFVGMEGSTGNSTGIHLHIEMQNIDLFNNEWHVSNNKSDYIDPTEYMGIDNIDNTWWIYDGTPIYIPTIKPSNNFKWVLYAHKRRNVNK